MSTPIPAQIQSHIIFHNIILPEYRNMIYGSFSIRTLIYIYIYRILLKYKLFNCTNYKLDLSRPINLYVIKSCPFINLIFKRIDLRFDWNQLKFCFLFLTVLSLSSRYLFLSRGRYLSSSLPLSCALPVSLSHALSELTRCNLNALPELTRCRS